MTTCLGKRFSGNKGFENLTYPVTVAIMAAYLRKVLQNIKSKISIILSIFHLHKIMTILLRKHHYYCSVDSHLRPRSFRDYLLQSTLISSCYWKMNMNYKSITRNDYYVVVFFVCLFFHEIGWKFSGCRLLWHNQTDSH